LKISTSNRSYEVENTSGLRPLGRAVLVKEYQPERAGSLIAIPDFVQERTTAIETRAIVVEVGAACWPDEPVRARVGDKVFISKLAGFVARGTKDGALYRFVNDRDIFAAIVEEA
jgi:co-chaperonin GroES (HSP10)